MNKIKKNGSMKNKSSYSHKIILDRLYQSMQLVVQENV
nr:MAG TPA: hypothetical protein [Caudoviricetes sp.]